jgi:hypothetical protein
MMTMALEYRLRQWASCYHMFQVFSKPFMNSKNRIIESVATRVYQHHIENGISATIALVCVRVALNFMIKHSYPRFSNTGRTSTFSFTFDLSFKSGFPFPYLHDLQVLVMVHQMEFDPSSLLKCPTCFLFMSHPSRKPMAFNCGHTICEQCLRELTRHICAKCHVSIKNTVHAQLIIELVDQHLSTHCVPITSSTPELCAPVPSNHDVCANKPGDSSFQPWFHCLMRDLTNLFSCCAACASFCHRGHDVVKAHRTHFDCDCGLGRCVRCLCREPPAAAGTVCTFSRTSRCFCFQSWYHCTTCGLVDSLGCCAACARICHAGHKVTGGDLCHAFCDCGSKCQCCPAISQAPHCTNVETHKTEVQQAMWKCRSCPKLNSKFICDHCVGTGHRGHIIEMVGNTKSFCTME